MTGRGETDVARELVRRYLNEIGSYPLLTSVEEVELALAMSNGRRAEQALARRSRDGTGAVAELERAVEAGIAAKRRFIQSNLRLVVSLAKRYQNSGLPLLDLIQEGNLGLIRAVEKFDHTKGFKFSTYATWWVRQAISRAIADKARTIRVPVHMLDAVRLVNRSAARLRDGLGREATVDEVAHDVGLPASAVTDTRELIRDPVSIHSPLGDGDGELADLIEDRDAEIPFERADAALRCDAVRAALETLSERERQVLTMRFGLAGTTPLTLEQVGRDFRLTRERIRQIEAKALTRLRHPASPLALRGLVDDAVAGEKPAGRFSAHAVN